MDQEHFLPTSERTELGEAPGEMTTGHPRLRSGAIPWVNRAGGEVAIEARPYPLAGISSFVSLIEEVALLLLGEPNYKLSSRRELRFGRHGSMSVNLAAGTWYDHEAGTGGGVLDLIRRETGAMRTRDCMAWLERARLIEGQPGTIDVDALRHRRNAERAARGRDTERRHAVTAERAPRLLARTRPADPDQAYLKRKNVLPHDARRMGAALVFPVVDLDRRIHSLQFIAPDGTKRLLAGGRMAGHFIPVAGRMPGASRILICEGWATGATLAEADPTALVLAAISAGNLRAVALQVRSRWPEAEVVVCCDRDEAGIRYGRAAAIAAGALVAVPEFPKGADGTDYNDLAVWLAERREVMG